jgi:hypothetical protein
MTYRNDHEAALARIEALELENARLKRQVERLRVTHWPQRTPAATVYLPQRDWLAVVLAGLTGLAFGLSVLATALG